MSAEDESLESSRLGRKNTLELITGIGLMALLQLLPMILPLPTESRDKQGYQTMLPKLDMAPPDSRATKKLFGRVGQVQVIPVRDPGNPWGYIMQEAKLPSAVTYVLPNSPSYQAGLRVGDTINKAKFKDNKGAMIVLRAGKEYACLMRLAPNYDPNAKTVLQAVVQKNSSQVLDKHNIVLLIDSSASMNTKDCPGGISRWEWCRRQAEDLCSKFDSRIFKTQIYITTFNSEFRSHSHCKLDELAKIFQDNLPDGETNLTPAIDDAATSFSSTIYSGKPVVVAVITDGRPTDSEKVKKRIIKLANELRDPSLLTLAFIEIGTPEKYLRELDTELVKQGAKADIVTLFPFASVNGQGLTKTLAEAVETRAAKIKASHVVVQSAPPVVPANGAAAEGQAKSSAPKPTPEELEAQRIAKEQIAAAESKRLRAAANNTQILQAGTRRPTVSAGSSAAASVSNPIVEVDEQESVRRKESNRSYKP